MMIRGVFFMPVSRALPSLAPVAILMSLLVALTSVFPPPVTAAEPPPIDAEVAVVMDGTTGEVLYDKGAHTAVAPASLTKTMTAIIAIEQGNLDERVTVDVDGPQMAAEDGSSIMGLVPGEQLSLRDLIIGMMLPSGNDAALAIARHIAGSEKAFVARMNGKAAELGMSDTHFANPHGMDDPNHYSSPYDMALLARYAMRNPTFASIVSMRDAVIYGHRTYDLHNINAILERYPGADGVKTGYTDNAMQAIVASARREGKWLIVALMRSHQRYDDAIALFDHFFASEAPVASPGLDWALPDGHFYTQANGRPLGQSKLGFAVTDEDGIRFWSEFQRLGGVDALGYPISQRFRMEGFVCQAFQRGILQWRPEVDEAYLVNIFDRLSVAGKDDWLEVERSTPRPRRWYEDTGSPWSEVMARHLALLDANPAIKEKFFSVAGDPVQINGLPMAPVADMGNVYVLRAQRAVFQQWKVDTPWARAGEVTVALGGDLAKEAGLLPAAALSPVEAGAGVP